MRNELSSSALSLSLSIGCPLSKTTGVQKPSVASQKSNMTHSWTICRRQWWLGFTLEGRHSSEFQECASVFGWNSEQTQFSYHSAQMTSVWPRQQASLLQLQTLTLGALSCSNLCSSVQTCVDPCGATRDVNTRDFEQNSKGDRGQYKWHRIYFHFLIALPTTG